MQSIRTCLKKAQFDAQKRLKELVFPSFLPGADVTFPFCTQKHPLALCAPLVMTLALGGLWGCDSQKVKGKSVVDTAQKAGYGEPALLQIVRMEPDGSVLIAGKVGPEGRVRVIDLDTDHAFGETAGPDGQFEMQVTFSVPGKWQGVRMLAVSTERGDRFVDLPGVVAVAPGVAAQLLPGQAAQSLLPTTPLLATFDYDARAAIVSGCAREQGTVLISVQGQAAGQAKTDARGCYALPLAETLKPGVNEIWVQAKGQEVRRKIDINLTEITSGPVDGGWRAAWPLPGGGAQISVLFSK